MVLNVPSEGAKGVYEDQTTVDPHALNEALTGTRPEDIERANTEAAYEGTQATGAVSEDAGIAENPVSEPIGADLETGDVATVEPAEVPEGSTPIATTEGVESVPGEDPADIEGSASSADATATGEPVGDGTASS